MTPLKLLACPVLILASVTSIAFAQDWYHDREARYQGDQWRGQVFAQVRSDLDHILECSTREPKGKCAS